MKRVCTLYRVSTKQQVDIIKDDIPMQRIAAHEFIGRMPDWVLIREFEEKGISGSKVSASKRDAIQDLKELALHHEFDVLLVFMFDRLGRIESETPFVLEWFVAHGIEMWSINEGQQKIESHVDKLTNYIRFWQAAGESEKTAIRVKARMEQMTAEGIYTGGVVHFGYTLVDQGRKNKKGQAMRDLAKDPIESEINLMLFQKTVYEGYGSHQLAKVLEEKGIRQHSGKPFTPNAVRRILKDELNRGFIVRGDVRSERVEELQIVSDELFFQAQKILEQRARKSEEKRIIAMTNKGKTLLNGNVYCAHCGCRLATSRYREEYTKSDGTKVNREYGRYICYHRSRGLNDCDGATTYNADKIDQSVIEAMRAIFARISGCPAEEKIQVAYKQSIASNHQMQRKLECDLQKDKTQLESLRLEIAKVLTGDSIFTQDDLMIAINALKSRIEEAESKLISLKSEDAEKKTVSEGIIPAYRQFKSWAEEFEAASWKAKKMIASQLFSRVEIGKGYTIHLVMNMTYQQFCEEWADPKDITATA